MKIILQNSYQRKILTFVILSLFLMCWNLSSFAFSVGPGFFFYSNYELVKMADDILLVTPESKIEEFNIRFKVKSSLKGRYKNTEIIGFGILDPNEYKGASQRGEFSRARPGTYSGAGSAYDYLIGKQYLIFVKKRKVYSGLDRAFFEKQIEGEYIWEMGVHSLSRDLEEVSGEDDPWVKAVRLYMKIAKLNDYEIEKAELKKLFNSATNAPVGVVDDIKRHFEAITPMKSYEDLVLLRNNLKTDKDPDKCVLAMMAALYPEAFDLVCKEHPNDGKYFFAVKHPERSKRWLEVFSKLDSGLSKSDALGLLLPNVTKEEEEYVLPLIKYVDPGGYSGEQLAMWIVEHPNEERIAALKDCVGKDYENKWSMAEAIALLGDKGILDWAIDQVASEKYVAPVYVIGYSPRPEALQAAKEIIASGDTKRVSILGYAVKKDFNKSPHRSFIIDMLDSFEKTEQKEQ